MTNPEAVYKFLKTQQRKAFCDDCLGNGTGIDRHEVNVIASTLALFPEEFERYKEICPEGCSSREKLLTRAR